MDTYRTRKLSSTSSFDNPFRVGVMTGTVHGLLSVALWQFFGFEGFGRMLETEPFVLLYALAGMILLGAVPGVFYAKWKTVSPGVLIGGLLGLTSYSTWEIVRDGLTPVDPTPFGWYVLLWVGIAIVIIVAGLVERRVTR